MEAFFDKTASVRFEHALAFHCAPSLAGIKPADLISWPGAPGETEALLRYFSAQLAPAGVSLRLMGRRGGRCLILVCREALLRAQLERPEVRALLRRAGYPALGGMEAALDHLARRLRGGEFPHEVGLFLGYPARDVEGFRRDGGRGCLCAGLWKVYGQPERALAYFSQCRRCRSTLCRRLEEGQTLGELFRRPVPAGAARFLPS